MRLAIVSHIDLSFGGGRIHIDNIAKRLGERDWHATLIFTTKHGSQNISLSNRETVLRRTFSIPYIYIMPKNLQFLTSLLADYDIIYWYCGTSYILSDFIFAKLLRSLHKPVIRGFHSQLFPTSLRFLANFVSIATLKNMHLHVVNSDDYRMATGLVGRRVHLIPPGVDTNFFVPSKRKSDRFTVAYVTTSPTRAKGFDLLPIIVRNVIEKVKDIHFLIVAPSNVKTRLVREMIKISRQYSSNITYIKQPLEHTAMRNIYWCSHLLLFPSRSEAFGITVLEAQSCGLPVIGFDIPGAMRDVVIHNVTGSRVKSWKQMVWEIIKFYHMWKEDEDSYKVFAINARKRALLFDWKIIATKFIRMLEEVSNEA